MLLTVLSVSGCPNAPVLVDHLRARIDERADDLRVIVVDDEVGALSWGMTGSPTLLVDGADPFATAGATPSIACRLYRTAHGTVDGAPTGTDLDRVLAAARTAVDERSGDGWIDPVGRAGQGRLAPTERGLRAIQLALLRAMAQVGDPPGADELDRIAGAFGRSGPDVLRELADEDYLSLDPTGRPRAIYPFATVATRTRLRISGGPDVWAMCAVDALGIAAMLDRAVDIATTDPITAEPIEVHASPDGTRCDPPTTVVFAGRHREVGPAERICCEAINFFASGHSAARWATNHPDVKGEILDTDHAARLGRAIFGDLLMD